MRSALSGSLAAAALLASGSCGEDRGLDLAPNLSRVTTVELTDSPFPYDSVAHVYLYVVRIDVREQPDTDVTSPDWRTVAQPNRRYDLISLTGGTTDTLGGAQIPPGTYRAVRMVIDTDSSSVIARDGRQLPVDWQSSAGRPTLYAIVEDPMQVPDTGAHIVIDFDVGRSFLCDAPCAGFVFSPVFRAVNRAATGGVSGRVRGDTLSTLPEPIADVTVTVLTGDPAAGAATWSVRATGKTDADGNYRILYLRPDTYILRADAPRASPFTPGVLAGVVVERGVERSGYDIVLPRNAFGLRIEVPGAPSQMRVGDRTQLTVRVVDSVGQPVSGLPITWTNLDTATAWVYPDTDQVSGMILVARAVGWARLEVAAGTQLRLWLAIAIVAGPPPGPIRSITLVPDSATLTVGDTLGIVATARDSAGQAVPAGFSWSSSDTTVVRLVSVSFPGNYAIVRGVTPGAATIRARADSITGTASITVRP